MIFKSEQSNISTDWLTRLQAASNDRSSVSTVSTSAFCPWFWFSTLSRLFTNFLLFHQRPGKDQVRYNNLNCLHSSNLISCKLDFTMVLWILRRSVLSAIVWEAWNKIMVTTYVLYNFTEISSIFCSYPQKFWLMQRQFLNIFL